MRKLTLTLKIAVMSKELKGTLKISFKAVNFNLEIRDRKSGVNLKGSPPKKLERPKKSGFSGELMSDLKKHVILTVVISIVFEIMRSFYPVATQKYM